MGSVFAGMGKAELPKTHAERPKQGKVICLINAVTMKRTTRPPVRTLVDVDMTVVSSICDGEGRKVGMEMFAGDIPGTRISKTIWVGDYFLREMKSFILLASDTQPSEVEELEAIVKAQMEAEGAEGVDQEAVWEYICNKTCAIEWEGETFTPTGEAGMFDGTVCVELSTTEKVSEVKVNGQPAYDENGNIQTKTYINTYFQRLVPMTEVAGLLDENEVKRYFGTAKQFETLLEAEQE